jgi:hypothetical protein
MAFDPNDFENEWAGTGRTGFGRYEAAGNRRMYRIVGPWTSEEAARKAILGYTQINPNGSNTLQRFKPWTAPDDGQLIAISADVKGLQYAGQANPGGLGAGGQRMQNANLYNKVELAVQFASVRYNFGRIFDVDTMEETNPPNEVERYCIKRVRRAQDSINSLPGDFTWKDSTGTNRQITFPIPVVFGYQEIDVTWLAIPSEAYPTTAIDLCMRTINADELELPDTPPPRQYPAGSVYLRSVSEEEMYFPDSTLGFNITYHFNVLMGFTGDDGGTGWNYLPAQAPADTWRRITRAGMAPTDANSGRYATSDFTAIFQPEPTGPPSVISP